MARKQIINPYIRFGPKAQGPYAQRISGSAYGRSISLGDLVPPEPPADFHAFGASSGVIKALVKGVGDVTFARSTAATVTDAFGQVKTAIPNELRFEYGRRVQNLFSFSEDLQGGDPWSAASGATIISATEVEYDGTNGARLRIDFATETGNSFVPRFRIRKTAGTTSGNEVRFTMFGNGTSVDAFLGDLVNDGAWHEIGTAPFNTTSDGTTSYQVRCDAVATLEVTQYQLERTTGQANQSPGEYVSNGVLPNGQFHGAMADGVKDFDHTNPNEITNNIITATVPTVTFGVDILGSDRSLSGWTADPDTTLGGTVTAYDGTTLTNNALILRNTEAQFAISNFVSLQAGVPYRYVFLAKAGTKSWCMGQIRTQPENNSQYFQLSGAGAIGTAVGDVQSKITQLTNGWYRCEMKVVESTTNASRLVKVVVAEADNDSIIPGTDDEEAIYADFTEVLPGYDDWRALFEQASENVVTQSADFTSGGGDWTVGNDVESIEDSKPSPIQSKNWWRLQAVAGGADVGRRILSNTHTKAAAVETWTATLYVEPDEVTWLRFQIQNPAVSKYVRLFFDLNGAGAVGTPTGMTWTHIASDIKKISSGAYRIRVTLQTDTDTSILMNATLSSADGNTNTTLTTGEGLRIQGAQLEKSSVPTTLIITTGAALGRTADDGDGMFDDANFEQANGAWYTDVWYGALNTGGANGIMSLHDGPSSVIYEQNAEHRANDGGGSSVVILEPSAVDYRLKVVTNFETGGPLDVGQRDVEGHGAFKWDGTPKTFDGSFPTGANAINVNYAISVPSRLRDLKGFKTSKGQQWFEENE